MARNFADIALQEMGAGAARRDAVERLARRLVIDDVVEDDVMAGLGKRIGDGAADAAPPAGDEDARRFPSSPFVTLMTGAASR